jgi:hypothetical protein
MNNFDIHQHKYLDHEIQATIGNYLAVFYKSINKIYEYNILSNYPDIQILIKYNKLYNEIDIIELQRFTRLKKLLKLNSI